MNADQKTTPLTDSVKFNLIWRNSAYYVSKHGIDSMEIVPASEMANLEAQLKAAQEENERLQNRWQPIETAPKDGTWILAICVGFIPSVVQWSEPNRTWMDTTEMEQGEPDGYYYPTHWQPLPQPPTT